MTAASIWIALPLSMAIAYVLSWALSKRGTKPSMAALWAFTLTLLVGVAALLSDSPAGMLRAVWPREAIDWLAVGAAALTGAAALQRPPITASRMTLSVGMLLGILIVCRLLYGSIYLRPNGTSVASLIAIAIGGAAIGLCWYGELRRSTERSWTEAGVSLALCVGVSATLGMSGSFQYGMIGLLVALASAAAWLATRSWPWVSNLVILMLLGLGLAFAELRLTTMIVLSSLVLIGSWLGSWPTISPSARRWGMAGMMGALGLCVGLTAQQFFKDVKGDNASYGGYEAYK